MEGPEGHPCIRARFRSAPPRIRPVSILRPLVSVIVSVLPLRSHSCFCSAASYQFSSFRFQRNGRSGIHFFWHISFSKTTGEGGFMTSNVANVSGNAAESQQISADMFRKLNIRSKVHRQVHQNVHQNSSSKIHQFIIFG